MLIARMNWQRSFPNVEGKSYNAAAAAKGATMAFYKMSFDPSTSVLAVGFDAPATNDVIVKEVACDLLPSIAKEVAGTKCLRISGPASLPVAVGIAHGLCHIVGAIAVMDPKLGGYVVAVSHDPQFKVGDIIPA